MSQLKIESLYQLIFMNGFQFCQILEFHPFLNIIFFLLFSQLY